MSADLVQIETDGPVASVRLNDPDRRNALGVAMFDALDETLATLASSNDVHIVLLHGTGRAFCGGFDLAAATADPSVIGLFIERLSGVLRGLRRMPQIVVGAVHGAAIAGGCALVSACDLVVVSATAKLGYPVHAMGVSPAVSIPTLQQAIGAGAARAIMMSGELIDGARAHHVGLAFALSPDDESTVPDARALCRELAGHGHHALRVTKAWLNELDGSLDEKRYDGPKRESADLSATDEARRALAAALKDRFA